VLAPELKKAGDPKDVKNWEYRRVTSMEVGGGMKRGRS
jgi:hypothetical protein